LLQRLAARDVDDLVADRQVLHGGGEDGGEGLEHAVAAQGDGRDGRHLARVQRAVHELGGRDLGQVALVVLEDERQGRGVQLVREQVLGHLAEALDVLLPAVGRGVGDEDQRVRALQHQAPRRRVERLARHRQHLQPQVEPAEAGGLHGQQVEEDRAVLGGVDGDELAAVLRLHVLVEHLQVGRLSAHGGAVVDDLDLDRPLAMVQLDHGSPPARTRQRTRRGPLDAVADGLV
jgi:hypothetical protein